VRWRVIDRLLMKPILPALRERLLAAARRPFDLPPGLPLDHHHDTARVGSG
jgi:hypothetical protein